MTPVQTKFSLHTALVAALALCAGAATAQVPNPSFSIIGHVEALTLDTPADPLSAGSVRVNGLTVLLPRNLLITLPGQYLTLNDIFRGPHPGSGAALAPVQASSGLALTDTPRPPVPFEIHVMGNIVGGRYIAGHAKIIQMDLGTGGGFVRAIDTARGELLVGAQRTAAETPAQTAERDAAAARVRLNDPSGVFGKPNAAKFAPGPDLIDERFALDPENAPVVAMTGFPMCIPRQAVDPDCPASNRPPVPNHTRFTCGPVAAEASSPALPTCNPAKKAPIMAGDHVSYAGALVPDPAQPGRLFIAAHALGVEAGIYTSPGANPAYVFIEEALMGMLGERFPNIDQEETSRFRTVGFTTDPSRNVDVMLMDVAPDGSVTERLLTVLTPQRAGQIGRIRVTLPSKSNFLAVTREVRMRIAGPPGDPLGSYTAPIAEYIYPENTRFGQRPAYPVPVPFENFCELLRGGGTLTTLGRTSGPALGSLTPFPESGHPTPQPRADGSATCL
jgi:hypothetical protein